jgi:tRNA modification GTPase
MHSFHGDTIVALATAQGIGALAIIRLSGSQSVSIVNSVFKGKDLEAQQTHTIHFGNIADGERTIDEVLVSIFKAPRSFTKEDSVELSCHGSPVIVKEIIKLLLTKGARLATPGEFTKRAFLNGRFDLAQAEAVADLIQAETENGRQAALNQMRGGFSKEIKVLREELIHFASMIELELDFGEEDVEFAKRDDLKKLIDRLIQLLDNLIRSFDQGNVIKNGVPIVIAGKPNAGKSTLLNTLLNEEKAIVSDIPGTTRDFIEDEVEWGGISYRFIDTAGLRETKDVIEEMGVQRTREQMQKAALILYLFDVRSTTAEQLAEEELVLKEMSIPYMLVANKVDDVVARGIRGEAEDTRSGIKTDSFGASVVSISALKKTNMDVLRDKITSRFGMKNVKQGDVLVTNLRHYQNLVQTKSALQRVIGGIDGGITGDFLAMDIRQSLHYLGEITGEITSDDLLANIFGKFCIGK